MSFPIKVLRRMLEPKTTLEAVGNVLTIWVVLVLIVYAIVLLDGVLFPLSLVE